MGIERIESGSGMKVFGVTSPLGDVIGVVVRVGRGPWKALSMNPRDTREGMRLLGFYRGREAALDSVRVAGGFPY
jgi:hypothetical protein